ncbi:MAG: hypothetical protein GXZ01_09620 [Clostridiaceae bacterium]|jgi:hypothetical protein|nr:hypothetical protein [Clostridiaceae bacterium]
MAIAGVPLSVLLAKNMLKENVFGRLVKFIFIILILAGGLGISHYLLINDFDYEWMSYSIPHYIVPVISSLILAAILYFCKFESEGKKRAFTRKAAFSLDAKNRKRSVCISRNIIGKPGLNKDLFT